MKQYRLCKFEVNTEELVEEMTFTEKLADWFLGPKFGNLPEFMLTRSAVDLVYSEDGKYVYELHLKR